MKKLKKYKLIFQLFFSFLLLSFYTSHPLISYTKPASKVKQSKKINSKAIHLVKLGVDTATKGDYKAAIAYLERALKIEPKYPDALFNAGSIYRVQKKHEDAYFVLQQLLAINPYDHDARLEKVLALIGMQNFKQASSELKKVPINQTRYKLIKDILDKEISNYNKNRKLKRANNSPSKNNRFYKSASRRKPNRPHKNLSLRFSSPTGITVDKKQNIYVADFLTNKIEKISANQQRQVFASGNQIMGPSGLVFDDKSDNLLVSNYKSGTVVSIDRVGKIKVLVNNLQKPYSIFLDENGKLYISEQGKKAVSIINIH
ncbi:MAG: tetratricopeptide repeat protein [Candidatus Caenarcaniphilales bacterium]|nr:tetratricopeptide repeat protein [Candidatus Caenarcaniphilales bacterium]